MKKGQTLISVAETFGLPPSVLARENSLVCELREGQIIRLPAASRDLYRVRGGESKTLLCGSPEQFEARNGTKCLYPGQSVFL
ncbi:MAG: LysM peptidoglycan-binding domain-containing protein [Clostridia bacterium]|nr:LysM peptidoglycan-binding domain-containing protein [Clostridia bacterium]